MTRRTGITLTAYAAMMLSLLTPLYEPLSSGSDGTWSLPLLGGAAVALGLGVARAWTLALAVVVCLAFFVAEGASGLAVLILVEGIPFLLVMTGAGLLLARFSAARWQVPVLIGLFALALVPAGWATGQRVQAARADRVPRDVEARLPTEGLLNGLCDPSLGRAHLDGVRRQARALSKALESRPDELVSYLVPYADQEPEREDITVRELAEEQLRATDGCRDPDIRRLKRQIDRE